MKQHYDVIVVGGGPAGIFAALELVQSGSLDVLLVEKGRDIRSRLCPARDGDSPCLACSPCNLVCGLGGAGAFSDGKLVLSSEVGGHLSEYLGEENTMRLLEYVDRLWRQFGAGDQIYGTGDAAVSAASRAQQAGLRFIPTPVLHMGTDHGYDVLRRMQDYLSPRLDLELNLMVSEVIVKDGSAVGIRTADGTSISCDYLVLAPGREGADWFSREAARLGLAMHNNPVDIGVRVEVPHAVMQEYTDALYEIKLEYYSRSFNDRIRTFCMCPAGKVITESTGGADPVVTVNGHSYAESRTDTTNFALLVGTDFTYPFREPIAYGKYVARLANLLAGGVLVQRFGDLLAGRRSTPERIAAGKVQPTLRSATPGDISFALPYRHLTGLIEMLQAMDRMIPGVASPDTLLYGIEVKFYSFRPQLNSGLETEIQNLFAIGDGAGVSRGLVQASGAGLIAAAEILRRAGIPLDSSVFTSPSS